MDDTKEANYLSDAKEYSEWVIKSGSLETSGKSKFVLKNHQCPGDLLMLTSCVRDIKIWYPHIQLDVRTSCDDLWINNPYLTKLDPEDPGVFELDMQYELIHNSNQDMSTHFIHGFIHDFNQRTGLAVKLTQFKPDVHLTDEEKDKAVFNDQPEEFVVIICGGKRDYEAKWWWESAWLEVVENCPNIQFIQVGGKDDSNHVHNPVKAPNCIDKIGKTTIRELMRLIYQSKGTISVVTAVMHMAACFDRHAAVIAGGHEPWWWERYPGHDYFHTIGQLNCCRYGGCWKTPCENKSRYDRQKCLELVDPKAVAKAVRGWFGKD